jgi:hypothetical protein
MRTARLLIYVSALACLYLTTTLLFYTRVDQVNAVDQFDPQQLTATFDSHSAFDTAKQLG